MPERPAPLRPASSALPADDHVHSQFSYDTAEPASMIEACRTAVELGVPAVSFTEHVDAGRAEAGDAFLDRGLRWEPYSGTRPLDVDGYLASIAECRERFPELRVRTGMEVGEPHLFASASQALRASGRFERVLGSLHLAPLDGELLDAALALQRAGTAGRHDVMRSYLREVAAMVRAVDEFEVLAHLDYPRRSWPAGAPPFREGEYEAEYRDVLHALAAGDRTLEINTCSPLASVDLIGWWRQEGGRTVSFGSDAHVPWRVGEHFSLAVDVVSAAGFGRGDGPDDVWRR